MSAPELTLTLSLSLATEELCGEREQSHLWGGRMCWRYARYECARCGTPICPEHSRLVTDDETWCVSCANDAPGGKPA